MLSFLVAAALAAVPPAPEPGVSEALARARASAIRDLRYDVILRVPADRGASGRGPRRRDVCVTSARRGRAGLCSASRPGPRRARRRSRGSVHRAQRPHRPGRRRHQGRRERDRGGVRGRRRSAEPRRRLSLHALRAVAGAAGVSLLRSAGSEGALHADADGARRPGRWRPTAAESAAPTPADARHRHAPLRRDAAAAHLSVRVRRRPLLDRDRDARRPRDADAAPRDRRGEGGAQPGRRSSICMPPRWPGWRTTPASRTRSASSTSC